MTLQEFENKRNNHNAVVERFKAMAWHSPIHYKDFGDWGLAYVDPIVESLDIFLVYPYCKLEKIANGDDVEILISIYWDITNYIGYPDTDQFTDYNTSF